eukprot:1221851-Pleurochrysis_carterae.AAC.1
MCIRDRSISAPPPAPHVAQALSDADMCIELRGEWSKGYTRRAAAMHGLKRFMAAVEAYEAAIEIEPDNETLRKGRRQSSFALAIE